MWSFGVESNGQSQACYNDSVLLKDSLSLSLSLNLFFQDSQSISLNDWDKEKSDECLDEVPR